MPRSVHMAAAFSLFDRIGEGRQEEGAKVKGSEAKSIMTICYFREIFSQAQNDRHVFDCDLPFIMH